MDSDDGDDDTATTNSTRVSFDISPLQIAQSIVARIQRPEDCYEASPLGAELIPALAPLRDTEIDAIAFALKQKFGKDFSGARNQRWWAEIRNARESARRRDRAESPYLLTNNGNLRANLANAKTMLSKLPIQYNAFSSRSFLSARSPWGTEGDWTDADDTNAAEWCQRQGLDVDIRIASAAAESIARGRTPHYHPVREYLEGLVWDKTPRCDLWLVRCLGVEDKPFARQVGAKWLIAAIQRVYEPGCQSDYTLVLEGPQGKRKSTALRVLASDEWFTDDITDIGTKDSAMQLHGKWIVELSELAAMRRSEVETIKSWLTHRADNFRPPYGRRAESFPRQNVFAATTNRDDWGTDETGLRRFWPVRVGQIDFMKLSEHRDQLWAEAVHRYRLHERSWLDEIGESEARDEQAKRQSADPWEDAILEWAEAPSGELLMSRPGRVLIREIMRFALHIPIEYFSPISRHRVARVLKLNRYECKRAQREETDEDGRRPEFWILRPF